jgi:hypothetical protein
VRIERLKVLLTGEPVGWGIWEELKFDAFRRVSGWVLYFDDAGRTAKRSAFYNAALIELTLYHDGKGLTGQQAATYLELHFSPATVDVDGQRLEAHSVIPWETDLRTSFRALTKPADPVPSAHLAARLSRGQPKAAEFEPAQPRLGSTPASEILPEVLGSTPVPTRPAPKMRTGAEAGLPATLDSIRTGEVAMEQHPDYPALVQHLARQGYPLVVQTEPPHVFFKRVCDKQGRIVREDNYVAVVAGMRFLDLEHEAGHVAQLEDRFGGNLPIIKFVQLRPDREVEVKNAPDVLQGWQDAVTEYHNRLVEYERLTMRDASPALLAKHLQGINKSFIEYHKALSGKYSKPEQAAWVKQYFPDLNALIANSPISKSA